MTQQASLQVQQYHCQLKQSATALLHSKLHPLSIIAGYMGTLANTGSHQTCPNSTVECAHSKLRAGTGQCSLCTHWTHKQACRSTHLTGLAW